MVQPHEADAGRVDEAGVPEYAGGGVVAACVGGDLWCRDAQVAGAGVRGGGVCRGAGVSVSFRMGFRVER